MKVKYLIRELMRLGPESEIALPVILKDVVKDTPFAGVLYAQRAKHGTAQGDNVFRVVGVLGQEDMTKYLYVNNVPSDDVPGAFDAVLDTPEGFSDE